MQLILAVDPELADSAEWLAHQWNSDESCAVLGAAVVPKNDNRLWVEVVGAVIFGIVTGVATNAIYDGIKTFFAKRGRKIRIDEVGDSQGNTVVRIVEDEENDTGH